MELVNTLRLFFFFDVVFCVTFCVSAFIEYRTNILMYAMIIVISSTYFHLFRYIVEAGSNTVIRNKPWYFVYSNTCVYYSGGRVMLLCVYVLVALVDMSALDISHTIMHFPLSVLIAMGVMMLSIVGLVILTTNIRPYHSNYISSVVNTMAISAKVTTSSDPSIVNSVTYSSFQDLGVSFAHGVFLMPNHRAPPLSRELTKLVRDAGTDEMIV